MKDDLPMPHYTKICADFELVTPAFIGSADKDKAGCIDPKAIKAALRYWWRVLNWGPIHAKEKDVAKALADLHQTEMRLFGLASSKQHGGQGLVQVVVKSDLKETTLAADKLTTGIKYLLGQGLYSTAKDKPRKGVQRDPLGTGSFTITLILYHPGLSKVAPDDENQILRALKAFGLLGSLGSRQNRGFGCVRMKNLATQAFANNFETYLDEIKQLFPANPAPFSILPTFCQQARMCILRPDNNKQIQLLVPKQTNTDPRPTKTVAVTVNDAWELLDKAGEQFLLERSFGSNKAQGGATRDQHYTMGNKVAEWNYRDDHDWIAAAKQKDMNAVARLPFPERAIYGLPYGFDTGKEISVKLGKEREGRRASPFHFYVTSINGQPLLALYLLPSTFLPDTAQLVVKMSPNPRNNPTLSGKGLERNYAIIDKFLNRFPTASKLQ